MISLNGEILNAVVQVDVVDLKISSERQGRTFRSMLKHKLFSQFAIALRNLLNLPIVYWETTS